MLGRDRRWTFVDTAGHPTEPTVIDDRAGRVVVSPGRPATLTLDGGCHASRRVPGGVHLDLGGARLAVDLPIPVVRGCPYWLDTTPEGSSPGEKLSHPPIDVTVPDGVVARPGRNVVPVVFTNTGPDRVRFDPCPSLHVELAGSTFDAKRSTAAACNRLAPLRPGAQVEVDLPLDVPAAPSQRAQLRVQVGAEVEPRVARLVDVVGGAPLAPVSFDPRPIRGLPTLLRAVTVPCAAADLVVGEQLGDGAGGRESVGVLLTNRSDHLCSVLPSTPISVLSADGPPMPVRLDDEPSEQVVAADLAPGQGTFFGVTMSFHSDDCTPNAPTFDHVRAALPGGLIVAALDAPQPRWALTTNGLGFSPTDVAAETRLDVVPARSPVLVAGRRSQLAVDIASAESYGSDPVMPAAADLSTERAAGRPACVAYSVAMGGREQRGELPCDIVKAVQPGAPIRFLIPVDVAADVPRGPIAVTFTLLLGSAEPITIPATIVEG